MWASWEVDVISTVEFHGFMTVARLKFSSIMFLYGFWLFKQLIASSKKAKMDAPLYNASNSAMPQLHRLTSEGD